MYRITLNPKYGKIFEKKRQEYLFNQNFSNKYFSEIQDRLSEDLPIGLNQYGELFLKLSNAIVSISNFIIIILEELFIHDGINEATKKLRVIVISRKKQIAKETCINYEDFHNLRWLRNLDIAFQLNPEVPRAYEFVKMAAIEASEPMKTHVATSIGWLIFDGKPVYVTNGEVIGYESES